MCRPIRAAANPPPPICKPSDLRFQRRRRRDKRRRFYLRAAQDRQRPPRRGEGREDDEGEVRGEAARAITAAVSCRTALARAGTVITT